MNSYENDQIITLSIGMLGNLAYNYSKFHILEQNIVF